MRYRVRSVSPTLSPWHVIAADTAYAAVRKFHQEHLMDTPNFFHAIGDNYTAYFMDVEVHGQGLINSRIMYTDKGCKTRPMSLAYIKEALDFPGPPADLLRYAWWEDT